MIYQACVSTASYYSEQKNIHSGTRRGVLRKIAGVPLAFFYGFLLVWIISNTIMVAPQKSFSLKNFKDNTFPQNICDTALSDMMSNKSWHVRLGVTHDRAGYHGHISNDMLLPASQLPNTKHLVLNLSQTGNLTGNGEAKSQQTYCGDGSGVVFENDCIELYYSVGGVMTCVGLASIFSRNIRTCMLLLLPGMITRHSRHLIFTITLGMLANGPIRNIQDNFNIILENAICVQKTGVILACVKQLEVKEVMDYAENIHGELQNIKDSFNRIMCPYGSVDRLGRPCTGLPDYPFPFPNDTYDVLSALSSPGTRGIHKHASFVMEKIVGIGYYGDIARRWLTVISILFLILDAICYLQRYLLDVSFDNQCVSGRTYR